MIMPQKTSSRTGFSAKSHLLNPATFSELRAADQTAFKVKCPGVIGAGDDIASCPPLAQQLVPAMGAYIVECAQLAIAPAGDEYVLLVDRRW